jgi:hypothetical protein
MNAETITNVQWFIAALAIIGAGCAFAIYKDTEAARFNDAHQKDDTEVVVKITQGKRGCGCAVGLVSIAIGICMIIIVATRIF